MLANISLQSIQEVNLVSRRNFSEQLCHLDETVLSNSFLSYKVLFNSKRTWEGHHAAISDRVKELASKEIKLLEENQVAQHRFSNLNARLQSFQDRICVIDFVADSYRQIIFNTYIYGISNLWETKRRKASALVTAWIWLSIENNLLLLEMLVLKDMDEVLRADHSSINKRSRNVMRIGLNTNVR